MKKTNRQRRVEANQFIRAMNKNIAEKFFFGRRVSLLVPGNRFLDADKPLAVKMGRKLILAWINAISTMVRFSHKERRAFVREWQSCLWEGEEVVNPIVDNRKIMLPVWGMTNAKPQKGPKRSMDELIADFGVTIE
jgi:hypothetical protein